MSFFSSPASKLERAVRALFVMQGVGTWQNTFIANESISRPLPNRTIVVRQYNPRRPYRPEGDCHFEIQHHFASVAQPGQTIVTPRVQLDAFVGDTIDLLNLGGGTDYTDLDILADAISVAGKWLTIPDPNDTTGKAAAIVAANTDMVNFRCDNVKYLNPFMTRGTDSDTTNWVEILHLSAFISHASIPN